MAHHYSSTYTIKPLDKKLTETEWFHIGTNRLYKLIERRTSNSYVDLISFKHKVDEITITVETTYKIKYLIDPVGCTLEYCGASFERVDTLNPSKELKIFL